MEGQRLRRGIEFTNRLWESGFAARIRSNFIWWGGRKLNRVSFACMFFLVVLTIVMYWPLFVKDVTNSYYSSALLSVANLLKYIGIPRPFFFSVLTAISIIFSPISIYLFSRRMALRHELTALIASMIFILPSPILPHGLPLVYGFLNRDGSHAFVFSFVPFFLLYVRAFLQTGNSAWAVISCIGTALISIISPFTFFNLLIFFIILAIAEGFLGGLRIKLARIIFIIIMSFGLSLFWYYPNIMAKIFVSEIVRTTASKAWSVLPLLIPAVPVLGTIAFLIFDRREKLKPLFIALSLFLVYISLFFISKSINAAGIFTAARYTIELSFSVSFLSSLIIILFSETVVRNYLLKINNHLILFVSVLILTALITFLVLNGVVSAWRLEIESQTIATQYSLGVGSIERDSIFKGISSILAMLLSLLTLFFLIFMVKKFPSLVVKSEDKQGEVA